jgi:predicted ATP-grasp superfamily ATP-dependent carboligase
MCAHGLAIARSLGRRGVQVHALEANDTLPGTTTRHAALHSARDLNGPGLIDALLELRPRLGSATRPPVLFLTNDNMVSVVAQAWPLLADHYRLSWSHCRETIAALVLKSSLQGQCKRAGLPYPRTWQLEHPDEADRLAPRLSFPVIAKPVRPLRAFKVRLLHARADLERLALEFPADFPVLIQDWISGGESRLSFCALYLDRGRVVARFDGRKLRARPMGHTTVAEPVQDDAVFEASLRFFEGLNLSGPVSLELKRDPGGMLWVIEPTIGRTDFWLGCCVANGVDLSYLEYCHQAELALPKTKQRHRYVWVNAERDPLSIFWYACQVVKRAVSKRPIAVLYWARDDIKPSLRSFRLAVGTLSSRVARKQACLWRALAAKARSAAPYRRRVTTFLTALIASSVANAVEFDGRKIDSSSRSEVAPAEGDGEVKRRLGR